MAKGLVLTRKPGESIILNGNIWVIVEAVNHDYPQVRLRIIAPPDVSIVRAELEEEASCDPEG